MTEFECKAAPFEFKFSNDQPGVFDGYGAIFDNIDDGGDMIKCGAFKASLSKSMPKMFVNHAGLPFGTTTATDMIPVGVWSKASEDSKGLAVEGRLINLDTERGKQIYGAMKEGAIDSLSIGYKATNITRGTTSSEPVRYINEARLFEVSPVAMPMNQGAKILQVKAMFRGLEIKTIREFEDFLRDVGGFSNAAAKAIAVGGFKSYRSEPRDEDGEELAALLKRAAASIHPH